MFVLSRRLGESLAIDDKFVLTVALLAEDFVELSLIEIDGTFVGSFTSHLGESIRVTDDIQVIVVAFEDEKRSASV